MEKQNQQCCKSAKSMFINLCIKMIYAAEHGKSFSHLSS